uniref:Uncharacterized protein n=1 Tax=viral metagenome TaxID=1070528 RepID=A0A6C0LY81_9ZZZZ
MPLMYRPPELKGGKASHKHPWDYDQTQLMKGIHVELEHTKSIYVAMIIAMDHLEEYSNYYVELEKMENRLDRAKRAS